MNGPELRLDPRVRMRQRLPMPRMVMMETWWSGWSTTSRARPSSSSSSVYIPRAGKL